MMKILCRVFSWIFSWIFFLDGFFLDLGLKKDLPVLPQCKLLLLLVSNRTVFVVQLEFIFP